MSRSLRGRGTALSFPYYRCKCARTQEHAHTPIRFSLLDSSIFPAPLPQTQLSSDCISASRGLGFLCLSFLRLACFLASSSKEQSPNPCPCLASLCLPPDTCGGAHFCRLPVLSPRMRTFHTALTDLLAWASPPDLNSENNYSDESNTLSSKTEFPLLNDPHICSNSLPHFVSLEVGPPSFCNSS